jgi:transcriptional regulator with GAF, ATPase, and Fis domain
MDRTRALYPSLTRSPVSDPTSGDFVAHSQDQQAAEIIEALRSVLGGMGDPATVLATILKVAVTRTDADRGILVEVRGDGGLDYRVMNGFQSRHFEGDSGAFSRSLFARVVGNREGVMLRDATDDPYFSEIATIQSLRTAAILCEPIQVDSRVAALVYLENKNPGHFEDGHRAMLRSLLEVGTQALETMSAGSSLRSAEQRLQQEAAEQRALLARDWSFGRFVGRSAAVRALEQAVREAAQSEHPALLRGESGTGKSLLARILHSSGPRADRPFVTVSCPSLEKGLADAELFGHRRGSFTSAVADRIGKVQAAEGGTLFLDEIGDLPLDIQPKLLRVLEERMYSAVGDAREHSANVRFVSATHKDLEQMVADGQFRRDLFERLNYLPIEVPPLRERTEDIPLLLRHHLDQTDTGRWIRLGDDAIRYLEELDFAWPGNVRHIAQLAARLSAGRAAAQVSAGEVARMLGAPAAGTPATAVTHAGNAPDGEDLVAHLEREERAWLIQEIRRHPGLTRAELAARAGISESALYRKLRQHGIDG